MEDKDTGRLSNNQHDADGMQRVFSFAPLKPKALVSRRIYQSNHLDKVHSYKNLLSST